MPVGFFLAASRSDLNFERISGALVAHTLWDRDGEGKVIDLRGRNWHVACMAGGCPGSSSIWHEEKLSGNDRSFVFILGWCHRLSAFSETLSDVDYRQMIERFRRDLPPLSDDYGGQFVAVLYDAERGRIAVQPDRLALGACFYAQRDEEFVASDRALRVANYFGSSLNGHSVLALMRGTHMPFGHTLFTGVRRAMGASYLEIDLARGEGRIKKPYSLFVPQRNISYADSVDLVADTVRTTVRRLLASSPVRFDLTGGNDTRVIASAVENITRVSNGHKFGFRVADPEGSPDVSVARRIANSCGWSLVRVDRGALAEPGPEELARAATTADGNFPLNNIWERVLSEREYAGHGNHWKTHVGASAGEIFRGFFYSQEMMAIGRSSNVNYSALLAYRTYASRGVDLRLFGSEAPTMETHDQVLLEPYRAIGEEGGSVPNAYKLDLMYLQRQCYRAGNTVSWLSGFQNVRLPFLSWELAGLALSLPWKYRSNRALMQRVIGKLSPKLSNIPNEEGEPMKPLSFATLPAYVAAEIPIGIDFAGRVIRRFVGRSGGTTRFGLPAPAPAYLSMFDQAKFVSALFDPAALRQIRANVESGQNARDPVTTFYVLCTIELLLQEAPNLRHSLSFD